MIEKIKDFFADLFNSSSGDVSGIKKTNSYNRNLTLIAEICKKEKEKEKEKKRIEKELIKKHKKNKKNGG